MPKFSNCLMAALLASALALPSAADAAPQRSRGGGGAPHIGGGNAPHFGGGSPHFSGRSFAPHFSARSIAPHFTARSFAPHVGTRSVVHRFARHASHFATARSQTHINHSALQSHLTHGNLANGINAVHGNANASLREHALHAARVNGETLHHSNVASTISAQAARQGRFASPYAARAQSNPQWRSAHMAARRAWRHGDRAGFVAWYGPVFWPYAYSDIFDYAFWPYGYDDGYWDYAYDDFIDGLFWGEYGPLADHAYAEAPGPNWSSKLHVTYAGVQELCEAPGTGVTAWPFAEMQRRLRLNDEQNQLLADVRKAAADAAATFKASCPAGNSFPLTPPGRLTAMVARLQATLDAVEVVQPALDKFYNSLSDEQKERFNNFGPRRSLNNPETAAALPQGNKSCEGAKPGLVSLPIQEIDNVVKPTDVQQGDFKALQDATSKAVSELQAACPNEIPLTPPGRLAAMAKRLQAMIDAATTVKQPLDTFYVSLSNEQKARFDRIGQMLAQAND